MTTTTRSEPASERQRRHAALVALGMSIARVLGSAVIALALVTLVGGWWLGIEALVRVRPGWPAMVPATSLLFLACGAAVTLWVQYRRPWMPRLIGAVVLLLLIAGPEGLAPGSGLAGDGMSRMTRLGFLMAAASLIALPVARKTGVLAVELLTGMVLTLSAVGVLGYIFDMKFIFTHSLFSQLSLPTAGGFVLLVMAPLLASPRPTWAHLFLDVGPGSNLLRLFVPSGLAIQILLGVLVQDLVQSGLISVRFAVGLLVMSSCAAGCVGLFLVARYLNRAARKETGALRHLHATELELSHAEALAARVQKITSLGRVAGGVAHDFNNLLTVIQGNLDLLQMTTDPAERQRFIDEALAATRRGADVTQKLLSYGSKAVLDPEPLHLDRKLIQLEGMLHRFIPPGVTLDIRIGAGQRRILADRAQLEQAVVSLVSNACDAIGEGGIIVIETGQRAMTVDPSVANAYDAVPSGVYLFLRVRDTGHGMTPDVLERVTDPFFTTKRDTAASGLGLSMVHGFCQQSGGFLEIESAVGIGTSVTMNFPETERGWLEETARPRPASSDRPLARFG